MLSCPNCGVELTAQVDVCFVCGTLLSPPAPLSGQERVCPGCEKRYSADYKDSFCACGIELLPLATEIVSPLSATPVSIAPKVAGKLIFFGQDRRPALTIALTKDVTSIGRLDAVHGCFPDIDVDALVEPRIARKVSRRHALILQSRIDHSFRLRPLGGNTGTQIETDMVEAMADYPLVTGTRFILGGAVRFKFESA